MSEHTNETTIANQAETIARLAAEKAAAPDWRDRPTCEGYHVLYIDGCASFVEVLSTDITVRGLYYGPIPEPPKELT